MVEVLCVFDAQDEHVVVVAVGQDVHATEAAVFQSKDFDWKSEKIMLERLIWKKLGSSDSQPYSKSLQSKTPNLIHLITTLVWNSP